MVHAADVANVVLWLPRQTDTYVIAPLGRVAVNIARLTVPPRIMASRVVQMVLNKVRDPNNPVRLSIDSAVAYGAVTAAAILLWVGLSYYTAGRPREQVPPNEQFPAAASPAPSPSPTATLEAVVGATPHPEATAVPTPYAAATATPAPVATPTPYATAILTPTPAPTSTPINLDAIVNAVRWGISYNLARDMHFADSEGFYTAFGVLPAAKPQASGWFDGNAANGEVTPLNGIAIAVDEAAGKSRFYLHGNNAAATFNVQVQGLTGFLVSYLQRNPDRVGEVTVITTPGQR